MIEVVVVKIDSTNNIYYLSPNSIDLKKGDFVIFENDGIQLFGRVIKEIYNENTKNLVMPLDKVLRKATKSDLKKEKSNQLKAHQALEEAKNNSSKMNLDMNFIDSYYSFDNSQLVLFFLADNRVDFRDLAKKMASRYKTRIELRQIGVRDKAKRVGGVGPCGLFLCCNSFLVDFNSVSINMAKNQMLALNPSKINGICGRLLCCLGYENDTYTELKKDLPKIGLVTDTPFGMGKVTSVDIFKRNYSVDLKEKGIIKISKDDSE